jgi:hypothetical protein
MQLWGAIFSIPTAEEMPMSRVVPVLLFSTALSLMASIQTKSEAHTVSGIPDHFFGTWTVNRDCTEAHSGTGGHTLPGSQFRVVRATVGGEPAYFLQALDQPGKRWASGWKLVKLEYRAGPSLKTIPADFECVPGEETSQPFLAQSGFSVSAEPYYAEGHWIGKVKIHGEDHHLLVFPRETKGADSAVILLVDADAGDNLQLDTGGTVISEN